MPSLIRFGVSLDKELSKKFDTLIAQKGYKNRSEAIRDLIREELVKREWERGKEVTGAVALVYDHHKRDLISILTDIQHEFHHLIISTQHVHLDHDNCLEIVVVKGRPNMVQKLAEGLRSTKGVKYGSLSMATTGKDIM